MKDELMIYSNNLYNKHLTNLEKLDKYKMSKSEKLYWKNKDIARLPAVYYFSKYVEKLNLSANNLLTFGGKNDAEAKYIKYKNRFDCDYWENTDYDIEDIKDLSHFSEIDFCFVNQLFEHICYIDKAIKSISKILVSGGYAYFNWPILNIPHGRPYFTFTGIRPEYILYICLENGFDIIEVGSWGNYEYIEFIYKNLSWPDFTQIPLHNDKERPCIGWVLVKKP